MGTHEHARAFDGPYTAVPCSDVNPTLSTVSHLINPDAGVVTEAYFEEFAIDYPFLAYASIFEPTLGEMVLFAGNFAPRGWLLAEGQTLSITNNQSLFAILGTFYGGDGRTTFGLPDMRCFDGDPGPRWIIAISGIFPSRN